MSAPEPSGRHLAQLAGPLSVLLLISAHSVATPAEAKCDRDCVVAKVHAYVSALVAHRPDQIELAETVRCTENGTEIEPGEGLWQTITAQGGYQQVIVDSGLESAVFFGAFEEGESRLLLAIRFRFRNDELVEVEHLSSRPDARNRLILRHRLTEPNAVFEKVLSPSQRSTREQLIAAANAYFDGIANSTDEGVPMHRECQRRENGVLLLRNPRPETEPCPIGFHRFNYITAVRDRRVAAVDEERGLVLVWAFFDVPGNIELAPGRLGPSDVGADGEPRLDSRRIPRSLYIAELFRVVGGKIRDIEAIMFNLDLDATSGW